MLLSMRCHCSEERLIQCCFIQCLLTYLLNAQLKAIVKDCGLVRDQQTRALPPQPDLSLSPQQSRLGCAKDSDESQLQHSHFKAPPRNPGLVRKAAPRARTGSGPETVTNIISSHTCKVMQVSLWTKVLVWVGEAQGQARACLQGGCSCSLGRHGEREQEPQLSSSPE